MLEEDLAGPLDVRVDDSMDRSVPVEQDTPAAAAIQLPAGGVDQEMDAPVYRVGPHRCRLLETHVSLARNASDMSPLTKAPGGTW
eukprot:4463791-Amphidinium_carterae.1